MTRAPIDMSFARASRGVPIAELMARGAGGARGESLRVALETSRIIGIALGILVERYRIIVEDALDVLVGIAHETGRDLSAVAQELVETGCCPLGEYAGTLGY